jgi:hypothetical protein
MNGSCVVGVSLAVLVPACGGATGNAAGDGGLGDTLSTTATQTDSSGQGGFISVPVGWVTMTATVVATGQILGTAHVYSSKGSLTGTVIVPDR